MSFLSVYLAYYYYKNSFLIKNDLLEERYLRYVSEEQLEEEKSNIKAIQSELTRSRKKSKNLKKMYDQSKEVNASLEFRIDNISHENEVLKNQLKELKKSSINSVY